MPEGGREFTPEVLAKGEEITRYYTELDENDPKNQPTDDETRTIPPIHTMIKKDNNEQT